MKPNYSYRQTIDAMMNIISRSGCQMSNEERDMVMHWKRLRKISDSVVQNNRHDKMAAIAKAFGSEGFTFEEGIYVLGGSPNSVWVAMHGLKSIGVLRSERPNRKGAKTSKNLVARYYYVDWEKNNAARKGNMGEGNHYAGIGAKVSGQDGPE